MSLSGYQLINNTVRYSADEFDFAGTLGDFIGNYEYSYGNDEYKKDAALAKEGYSVFPTGKSNIWHAMSAIGQDIGEVTYANIKNYIDIVSNIDMCKTRSLMSMMKNLGIDYSIINNINDFPVEVLNLIDIFSIDKKYLFDNDKIKEDLIEDLQKYTIDSQTAQPEDYYRCFANGFKLSVRYPFGKGVLELDVDNGYDAADLAESARSLTELIKAGIYNERLSAAIYRKYSMLSGGGAVSCSIYKLGKPVFGDSEADFSNYYAVVSGNAEEIVCSAAADDFEKTVIPYKGPVSPFASRPDMQIEYLPGVNQDGERFEIGYNSISDEKYSEYVKNVFLELLSSYLDLRYNITSADVYTVSNIHPIYYYIKDEYQQNQDYYKDRESLTSDIMLFKRANSIPLAFNEQRTIDNIDAGLDSLDNYTGRIRVLLDMEISRRARRLTYKDMAPDVDLSNYSEAVISSDNFNDTAKNKTRYSYYRKAKVLEYARFIDSIFASGNIAGGDVKPYRFDANGYEVGRTGLSSIFQYDGAEPSINVEELQYVAENLTRLVRYIAKLRNKVKLQVRKNYMKGTNNLLVYLINEFLVDYSRTNRIFNEQSAQCPLLLSVYGQLSSSDIDDIEVVEYRDDTEYYNLSSAYSVESLTQEYNNDFKSAYFKRIGNTLSAFDGKTFSLDQIKEFYLSSLGLKNSLSDTTDDFIRFMASVFEIGQNDSFIDVRGNFACKLDDGRYTVELWDDLNRVSSYYTRYKSYLSAGDHEYPADTVQNQLTDMVENYMGNKLSDLYLDGVSDVYDRYHGDIEEISAAAVDISSQYTGLVEGGEYSLYLNKSKCKYCYTDGEEDLARYRHDWYNGNSDVYNSTYLIDKIGDLKRFMSDAKNFKCYPVLDTLDYVRVRFSNISSQLMANAERPAEEYGYVDIMSPFLDEEMHSIYAYLENESNLRKTALQNMLANIRQQAQQAKDTYDKLDNTFNQALANYDTGDGTTIGQINDNYFCKCLNPKSKGENVSECSNEKYFFAEGKTPLQVKKKYKNLEDEPILGVCFPTGPEGQIKKGTAYRLEQGDSSKDPNANAPYDKLDVGNGTEDCTISEEMDLGQKISNVETWMNQITSAYVEVDVDEDTGMPNGDCHINELGAKRGYANAGVLAAVQSIRADLNELEETVDVIIQQISDIGGDYSSPSGNTKDIIDDLQKYLGTEIDENFTDDPKLKAYGDLRRVISQLNAQFDNLKLVYDAMPSDDEYAGYIMNAYKSDFTLENIDSLSAYAVEKGVQDKTAMTLEVKQLIDKYNTQQNLYTAVAEQIEPQLIVEGVLEPDPYLELLVEYMHKKLLLDIDTRIWAAQEKIEADKNEVRQTIRVLSTQISSQMSAYEHDFEYYFDQYLSTLNYFQHPEYLSAYEIFKTYGGTSACYDPYYNYKNIAHASFQTHPFLWNFVEATGVRDIVSRSFDGLLNEKLERSHVRKYIDGIIGQFGQIVNIWQNNTVDCTGYTTRYEINTHTDEGVDYSPVVDYDGGFYPPAVESYLADRETAVRTVLHAATSKNVAQNVRNALSGMQLSAMDAAQIYEATSECVEPYYSSSGYSVIVDDFVRKFTVQTSAGNLFSGSVNDLRDMVQARLSSGTFFENYYGHLNISNDRRQLEFIAGQLSCEDIYRRIRDIAETKDQISDVYDIYKYGLDYQKNIYVLYKKYREPNPTYKERRNTPGALWIRLKNHPIAFPALLSGESIKYQAVDALRLNNYLSSVCDGRAADFIDIDKYCYDFDFSFDREAIAMPCISRKAVDPIFRTYDYPELVMSIIENMSNTILTRRKLLCFSNNDGATDDIVEQAVPSVSEIMNGGIMTCPAYIGSYSPSLKNIRLVYAYKDHARYSEDTDDILSVRLHTDNGGNVKLMFAKYNEYASGIGQHGGNMCIDCSLAGPRSGFRVASHEIAFTCDDLDKEKLTFAFPVERETADFKTYNETSISVDPNAEGGCLDDPSAKEITSHDIFDEHIAIVHAHFNNQLFQDGTPTLYNLNADMSYQPVYPGYGHRYDSAHLTGYENIELLGKSRDISKNIAGVNPNANPYFQLSDLLENGAYGRVYEDFTQEIQQDILNKTFSSVENPAFGENKAEDRYGPQGGNIDRHYIWHVDLPPVPSADVMRMNFVMFNTRNMGKNPYFIGKMAQFAEYTESTSAWFPAYYNTEDSERECIVSSDDVTGKYSLTGINRQGYTNAMDNNRIGNIAGIKLMLDIGKKTLDIRFEYADMNKEAHIDEGLVRCIFYDDKNITQFQHYHMLDAYGAINAYELIKNGAAYDQVIKGDGWKIIYDNTKYDEDFEDKIRSFILNSGQRMYLEDIDLAQYSFLSDVYVYKDNKLAFKYNEEDMFEYTHSEYHYPFLNRKYPNTIAQYYASHMNFSVMEQSQSDNQLDMFDESNLFILNYAETDRILSAMGRIAIPIYDVDEDVCVRVFEDYLSVYSKPGLDGTGTVSGYNSDLYAEDDPRILQFAHYIAQQKRNQRLPDVSALAGGRAVPDDFWERKTIDEFCDSVYANLSGCQYMLRESQHQTQDSAVKYVYVTPTAENCDISGLLDIQVNYRRDKDKGLTLFFNYANYVNTPFVKYVDGKFMIDTIDRTYLMLKPGESGELDIVVQARYYIGDKLYGYRNAKVLTFKIHNLSDDKPKFYITKTYELQPNSLDFKQGTFEAKLGVIPKEIDLGEYSSEDLSKPISCDVVFTVESNRRIRAGSTIEIAYPAHMIRPAVDVRYGGYTAEIQQAGVMLVKIIDPDITQLSLRFQTTRIGNMMAEYANRRYAFVYGKADIFDVSGRKMDVTSKPGAFMIKNDNTYILSEEDDARQPIGVGVGGDEYKGMYVHSF